MTKTIAFVLSAALAGACAGTGEVQYAGQVRISQPELVQIDRGVYVLADADEPVFYTDDSYWLYRNQRWYRSDTYTGGWLHVESVPRRLRVIEREPTAYVHYRTRAVASDRRDQPERRYTQPYQRDPYAVPRQPAQPTVPAQPYPNPRPPQQQPPVMPNDPGTVDRDRNPYGTPQTQPVPPAPQPPVTTPVDRDHGPHGTPTPRTDSPADHDRGRGNDQRPTPPATNQDRPQSTGNGNNDKNRNDKADKRNHPDHDKQKRDHDKQNRDR